MTDTQREKVDTIINQRGTELLDPEQFNLYVRYPHEDYYASVLDRVLSSEKNTDTLTYSNDTLRKIKIYYTHYDLLEKQLTTMIKSKEGSMIAYAKARFMLKHYINELKQETTLPWNNDVSYELPHYGTKDTWTQFIASFYDFMDGRSDVFITAHNELTTEINHAISHA